jgi:hypothetical protein
MLIGSNFINIDRNTPMLLPLDMRDWFPDDHMVHKLKSPEAAALYALRKQTVEPAFGIIKHAMRFRQFLMRGKENVTGEWNLVCTAYNLKRTFNLIKAQAATALFRDMAPNA